MSRLECEVAIAGGGPAGAIAALTLASAGVDVVLIESSRYTGSRVGEMLPPSARPLLTRLGLWEAVIALGATPSHGHHSAWGGPDLLAQSFIFHPHGHGWHLDRARFDSMLAGRATAAGARLIAGTQVTRCELMQGGSFELSLRTDDRCPGRVTSRAIIDATGRHAALARRLGARLLVHDHLVGVAAVYRGAPVDAGSTMVEAVPDGWWYCAPTPPDGRIAIFMTDADICRSQHRSVFASWQHGLSETHHIYERLKGSERLWGPRVFPAFSHRLDRRGAPGRWLAAGDAALAVDPLSSSGIVRALRTGEATAAAMACWLRGDGSAAQAYERGLDAEFAEYLRERGAYYALEPRWSNESFWLRRAGSRANNSAASIRG